MDVSIVVCTYNRAPSLRHTLRALDVQITPPHLAWELLVVDNNSTDATRHEFETFAASSAICVRYVTAARLGLSHARNVGFAETRGQIIAFTDDDADPAPDWVARIAEVMVELRADILGGCIVPAWSQPPPPWLERRSYLRNALSIMDHPTRAVVVTSVGTPTVWGANMAVRREVFASIGLFDPRRGVIGGKLYRGEEGDLVERALAAGFRVAYDPRVLVRHRIGADRMRLGYFSRVAFYFAEGHALAPETVDMGRIWRSLAGRKRERPDILRLWLKCCEMLGVASALCKRCLAQARSLARGVSRAGQR